MDDVFFQELKDILNKHGFDSKLNIPDFILAGHLCRYLDNLQRMNKEHEKYADKENS